ncbi:MAG: hypothetical protein CL949_10030 [Erythrobacter sp.]|nr:hypothetical protein [Erythrobacter sp.]
MRKALHFFSLSLAIYAVSIGPAQASDAEAIEVGRCSVPDAAPVFDRRSGSLPGKWAIESKGEASKSMLPALMVDGWKPEPASADVMLGQLMEEAGLAYSGPAGLPAATWDGKVSALHDVVDTIVSGVGGDWSFDGKTLHVFASPLPSNATATFPLPADRDQRLATIDMLRAFDLSVTVENGQLAVSGSQKELTEARKSLSEARDLRVFDVVFLRGRPTAGRYNWSELGAIRETAQGAGGRFVFSDEDLSDFITRMERAGDLVEDSAQSVAAPQGWQLSVPAVQCGSGSAEVLVGLDETGGNSKLTVSGQAGISEFEGFTFGTTALSVATEPSDGWISMVAVRPRVVNFAGI